MADTHDEQVTDPQGPVEDETSPTDPNEEQQPDNDEFKSEASKKAVLADLTKEREAKKALQAKLEQYEAEKAEAEKAKLSDIERAQAEAQEARDAEAKANAELLKYRIAGKHSITDEEDIELFLTGSDEETLTRQAERLAKRNSGPRNPQPDPSAGPKGDPALTDAEKVAQAEKAGDQQAANVLKAQQLGKLSQKL